MMKEGLGVGQSPQETAAPVVLPPLEELVVLPTAGDVFSITEWDIRVGEDKRFEDRVRKIFGTYGNTSQIKDAYGFHLNERGFWEADSPYATSFRQFLVDLNGIPVPEFLSKWEEWIKEMKGNSVGTLYTFVKERKNPENSVGLYMSFRTELTNPFSKREQRIYIAREFYERGMKKS